MGSTRFGGSASRRKPFRIYRTQGKHQHAIKDYDEAIQRHPNDVVAYQGRAAARESLGK
jgi:tetratricopeptide (TPR) repeat protein